MPAELQGGGGCEYAGAGPAGITVPLVPRFLAAAKVQTQEIVHRIFFHPIGPGCIQVVSARSLPCLGRPKFVFSRNPCRVFHESTLIFSKIIT